jgi:hypothetical protein
MHLPLLALVLGAELVLPAPSPPAVVSQVAGLTRITVAYHSTAKPRPAPGRLWLLGDQGAPTVTFSKDVGLAGTVVPAGVYSLLVVPSAKTWTIILNRRSPIWRPADRDPALDVVRFDAPAETIPPRARLGFEFSDFSERLARLDLQSDTVRVRIPVILQTAAQVDSALRSLDDTWRQYADVARFMLEKRRDFETGLDYINRSIALRETPYNTEIKASLLAARDALTTPPKRGHGKLAQARLETFVVPTETTEPDLPERKIDVVHPVPAKAPAPTVFAPIIHRGLPDLRRCYQRALRQDPSLSQARLTVSIAVGSSGRVVGVSVTPPLPSGPLEACLEARISRWAFPPAPQDYETLVPLTLRGRN